MNEISSEFILKLEQGVYDDTQVHEFLQNIQNNVKSTVSSELDLMTRMNILLLQQILTPQSSIKWGLLEDEILLNKIKEFEEEEELIVKSQRQRASVDQSNMQELQNENSRLKQEILELKTQFDTNLQDSNAVQSLLGVLERKNVQLKKLKEKLQLEELEFIL